MTNRGQVTPWLITFIQIQPFFAILQRKVGKVV